MRFAGRVIWIGLVLGALAMAQEKPVAPRVWRAAPIGARLRELAGASERVAVLIVLREQPQREILERLAPAAERERLEERYRGLAGRPSMGAELQALREEWNGVEVAARRAAFGEIEAAVGRSQAEVEGLVVRAGGAVRRRYLAINMIAATVESAALEGIAGNDLVAEIVPVRLHSPQLQTSVPELGATSFWNAGFIGAGQSVALLDTGVRANHPAFGGLTISNQIFLAAGSTDSCFGDDAGSALDLQGHGTHVAGIIASRGASDCPNCRGVARGLGTLYNAKIGYLVKDKAGCGPAGGGAANSQDVLDAVEWLARNTPVRIFNYSYGGDTTEDDDAGARLLDQLADNFGLLPVVSAGNAGPGAGTVLTPGIGWNVLSIANWSSRGTIAGNSSRGPTVGGRKKPDLAAPGTSIQSTVFDWANAGVNDFGVKSGTSMATPHIAGAAALLTEAGVNDPLAIRAILLNTTDNPGWAADRGWGYANLDRARNALFYRMGSVTARGTPGSYQLYRVRVGSSLRATLTWNRHVLSDGTSIFHDLDVSSYDTATGTPAAADGSADDNVEQLYQAGAGDYVVKVRMYNTSLGPGVSSEKFAIAFSEGDVGVAAGPRLGLSCTVPGAVPVAGAPFSLECTATNTGDLAAFGTTGSVTLATGFAGVTSLNFGAIPAGGAKTVALALTASGTPGSYSIGGSVQSTAFEETFGASATVPVTVNPLAPAVPGGPTPADVAVGVSGTPVLSWTAAARAASYDVYFGATPNPPLAGNTTGLSFSPGALNGETQYYWRVVAKNVTGAVSSPVWTFTTQILLGVPATPLPANASTAVGVAPVLEWTASGSPSVYDVYFGTAATPPLAASLSVASFNPGTLAAAKTYYWRVVARKGAVSVSSPVWTFTTVPKAFGLNPPTLVSATPAAASGSSQLLTFSVRDADGFDDVNRVYFLVNGDSNVTPYSCSGYYERASNSLFLRNDTIDDVMGPLMPGAGGAVENSQCSISGISSALVVASGVDLSVRIGVSLKGAFGGSAKKIFVWVLDDEGNSTGWIPTGNWTSGNVSPAPSLVSALPASAAGSPQTFTIVLRDPGGSDTINRVYFLINKDTTVAQNTCHGYYDRAADAFVLYDDLLASTSVPVGSGSSKTAQNSQCLLDGSNSGVTGNGTADLTLRMNISLRGSYGGNTQRVYLWITDSAGFGSGWVQASTWSPPNLNRAPVMVSGSPAAVTAASQTLTFTVRDADGSGNLGRIYFLIQSSTNIGAGTCHGYYDRSQNGIYLYSDALTTLHGPLAPGAAGAIQNSQCSIDGAGSSWSVVSPTDGRLALAVTLKGAYLASLQRIYVWVTDYDGNGTGWVQTGAWTSNVAALAPAVVSGTPSSALGSPQVFTVVARSVFGAANLGRIYFLVNSSATVSPQTCHGYYDRLANHFVLYNDSLSTALGPVAPGAPVVIQNSQCALDGATSGGVSMAGTDLSVRFGVSLKAPFGAAARNVYFWAQENGSAGSGWVQTSTWLPAAGSAQAPVLAAATPTVTSGNTQTFTLTARDGNGFADIQRIYFVVNPSAGVPVNSCHGFYDRPSDAVYLYNDALSSLTGPLAPGVAGTLQNSQCLIDGPGSAISASGGDLQWTLAITRRGALASTAQKLYVWITDSGGLGTGWVQASQWNP